MRSWGGEFSSRDRTGENREVNVQNREQCSRPGCRGKPWANQFGGSICFKHTVEMLSREGIFTSFNRHTYICRKNNMRFEDMIENRPALRAHWQDCPRGECSVNSCPHLVGIPRA